MRFGTISTTLRESETNVCFLINNNETDIYYQKVRAYILTNSSFRFIGYGWQSAPGSFLPYDLFKFRLDPFRLFCSYFLNNLLSALKGKMIDYFLGHYAKPAKARNGALDITLGFERISKLVGLTDAKFSVEPVFKYNHVTYYAQ